MDPAALKRQLADEARRLGFARLAFARAGPCRDRDRLVAWLAAGRHGEMSWMERDVARRTDPRALVPDARTVVVALSGYFTTPRGHEPALVGRVSRYAWGSDYHLVVGRRLRKLAAFLRREAPGARVAAAVDFRPVLEREWAERAGLGWIGKHTNLITQDGGSWFFVAELVTDVELFADEGPAKERCGRCTECLDACPTGAIVAPWTVDARRCISYLTIELRGPIPVELRPLVGEWIFGCDVCQDVCPWNRFAVPVTDPRFAVHEGRFRGDPAEWLGMTEEEFLARFAGSPVRRARRDGFLRNVCVALGNRSDARAVPALVATLGDDPSPLVRGHAGWALGRLGGRAARNALADRVRAESDAGVRAEIAAALAEIDRRETAPERDPRPGDG